MDSASLTSFFKERFYFFPGIIASRLLNFLPSSCLKVFFINVFFKNSRVHPTTCIHNGIRFLVPKNIFIDEGCTINSEVFFDTRNPVVIGSKTMIGHACKIYTLGHDYEDVDFRSAGGAVHIGSKVIIFSDVKIMPSVSIADEAVVLGASVVCKDVAPKSVIGGNPARHIKERKSSHSVSFNYKSFYGI